MTPGKEESWQKPSEGEQGWKCRQSRGPRPDRLEPGGVRKGHHPLAPTPLIKQTGAQPQKGKLTQEQGTEGHDGRAQTARGPCLSCALWGLRDCAQSQGLLSHRSWAFREEGRRPQQLPGT